jgi:glyceraldehyde 3-phosphate dehydrogenase
MSPIRVGINGFGRIGRALAWILLQDKRFEVAAINDVAAPEIMAHLYRFDSIHGRRAEQSDFAADRLIIDGKPIPYSRHLQPKDISWDVHDVQFVVECTGQFKTRTSLQEHFKPGVQRVLLSVPPEDDSIPTLVMGINEHLLSPEDRIISNASCTTNNAAPMIQLIDELCGIESCYITTVHSYTGDQRLHDSPHHDLRRSRGALQSIIPTTTGAAKALTRVFPHLHDKMGGCGFRVPVPDGSLTDITCNVRQVHSIEVINAAFREAAASRWPGILTYTEDPIVSSDVIGESVSCLFDAKLTSVIGQMVKVVGWYDNEMGYSHRLRDVLLKMA